MPHPRTAIPAVERFRYQFPSLGRNTERSVLPSPSKSARDLTTVVVHRKSLASNVNFQPVMVATSPETSSTPYKLHVPFIAAPSVPKTEANVALPVGPGELHGAAGAGAGKASAGVTLWSVGFQVPFRLFAPVAGIIAAPSSEN